MAIIGWFSSCWAIQSVWHASHGTVVVRTPFMLQKSLSYKKNQSDLSDGNNPIIWKITGGNTHPQVIQVAETLGTPTSSMVYHQNIRTRFCRCLLIVLAPGGQPRSGQAVRYFGPGQKLPAWDRSTLCNNLSSLSSYLIKKCHSNGVFHWKGPVYRNPECVAIRTDFIDGGKKMVQEHTFVRKEKFLDCQNHDEIFGAFSVQQLSIL